MKKITKMIAVSTILFLLLTLGCDPKITSNTNGTNQSIRVGYVPIADCLQLYVAQDKGFFAKQGLTVEVLPLQSGTRIIEGLVSKSVDIGISNVVTTIISNSKGVPIVAFTGGPLETETRKTKGLVVLETSAIKTPKDLAGKTIAVNALRNIEYVMLQHYLTQNGVALDSVKIVEAPFPQMEGILKGGSVDAAMAIEPYMSLALKNKTIRVLGHPYTDFKPQVAVSSYDIRMDLLKEKPETAKKFANAIAEATEFIKSNDAEARQILIKYTNAPAEVANDIVIPEFVGRFAPEQLQSWIDELSNQKILEKSVTVQDVYQQQ